MTVSPTARPARGRRDAGLHHAGECAAAAACSCSPYGEPLLQLCANTWSCNPYGEPLLQLCAKQVVLQMCYVGLRQPRCLLPSLCYRLLRPVPCIMMLLCRH